MKPCRRCGELKPLAEFSPNKKLADGYQANCHSCAAARMREWRKNNPDKNRLVKQRSKEKRKDADRAYMRQWRERNLDHTRQYGRDYYREHQAAIAEWREQNRAELNRRTSEWAKGHPEERVLSSHRKRARKAGTAQAGHYSVSEWKALCERANSRCLACGMEKKLTVDHVIPFSKGGANTVDNIQPLCWSCNYNKRDEAIDYRPADWITRE